MLEDIIERYPDEVFYTADGLDEAIIGIEDKSVKLIYSVQKILDILMERDGMEYEEALEFFDYNIGGAYISDNDGKDVTPIYCYDLL